MHGHMKDAMQRDISPFQYDYSSDGPEVKTIRRETVNEFSDWQEGQSYFGVGTPNTLGAQRRMEARKDAIASPETDDPQPIGPMAQREKEILQSFCVLSRTVMDKVFKYRQAADCLCPDRARHPLANFEFSNAVFDYIRNATFDRMQREGKL